MSIKNICSLFKFLLFRPLLPLHYRIRSVNYYYLIKLRREVVDAITHKWTIPPKQMAYKIDVSTGSQKLLSSSSSSTYPQCHLLPPPLLLCYNPGNYGTPESQSQPPYSRMYPQQQQHPRAEMYSYTRLDYPSQKHLCEGNSIVQKFKLQTQVWQIVNRVSFFWSKHVVIPPTISFMTCLNRLILTVPPTLFTSDKIKCSF